MLFYDFMPSGTHEPVPVSQAEVGFEGYFVWHTYLIAPP